MKFLTILTYLPEADLEILQNKETLFFIIIDLIYFKAFLKLNFKIKLN